MTIKKITSTSLVLIFLFSTFSSQTLATFNDIPANYPYIEAINYVESEKIVTGYSDGGFHPNERIRRDAFTKIIINSIFSQEEINNCTRLDFPDVDTSNVFAKHICLAKEKKVVQGFSDGNFHPADDVGMAEVAKIITISFGISPAESTTSPWYAQYLMALADHNAIPMTIAGGISIKGYDYDPSRGEIAEIIWRLRTNNQNQPSKTYEDLLTPSSSVPMVGNCKVFPEDNAWNLNVQDLPVHPNSANFISSIGLSDYLHPDFGSGEWEGAPIGIPYTVVDSSQNLVNVEFTAYGDESDPGPYRVPLNSPIEGGANGDGDRHAIAVDKSNCKIYELYRAFPQGNSWEADSGAIWDMNSNGLRPLGWTSADAAGLPIFPGLARFDEIANGEINHALRFTVSTSQRGYILPATHYASSNTSPNVPPMGLRVRLRADFDISGYTGQSRVILEALKKYGMIVADNGSDWYISGAPDPRWDNDDLNQLKGVPGSAFEAVYTGEIVK